MQKPCYMNYVFQKRNYVNYVDYVFQNYMLLVAMQVLQ